MSTLIQQQLFFVIDCVCQCSLAQDACDKAVAKFQGDKQNDCMTCHCVAVIDLQHRETV